MGQICLGSNDSRINPHIMRAKFGCSQTVVSKKEVAGGGGGGGGGQTDAHKGTLQLITVFCPCFQKGRVPSEKGTFSAVNGPSKGHH